MMALIAALRRTAMLMIGLPDYDAYVAHLKAEHPDKPIPSRGDFVAERQRRRYGEGGPPRCC